MTLSINSEDLGVFVFYMSTMDYFDKLKADIITPIIKERKRFGEEDRFEKIKDIDIDRFNPKFNYIKHKWRLNFVTMILSMYLKQDAIIKDISHIKARLRML